MPTWVQKLSKLFLKFKSILQFLAIEKLFSIDIHKNVWTDVPKTIQNLTLMVVWLPCTEWKIEEIKLRTVFCTWVRLMYFHQLHKHILSNINISGVTYGDCLI